MTVIAAMIIVFGKFGRMVTVVRADNASITGVNTDKTGDAENTGSVDETDDAENIGKAVTAGQIVAGRAAVRQIIKIIKTYIYQTVCWN